MTSPVNFMLSNSALYSCTFKGRLTDYNVCIYSELAVLFSAFLFKYLRLVADIERFTQVELLKDGLS